MTWDPAGNIYVADAVTNAMSFHASALWYLGRPDAAIEGLARAVERADAIGQPYTRVALAQNGGILAAELGDADAVRRRADWARKSAGQP